MVYLAAGILILHSFIPHNHYEELTDNERTEIFADKGGFIDYMKLIFLTDLGEDHMETFDRDEQIDHTFKYQIEVNSDIIILAGVLSPTHLQEHKIRFQDNFKDDIPLISQYFLSHIDFRGPPDHVG